MKRIYTAEQQQAIDTRGKNILVSAAAGSGKTAVLTERIVQQISGTNPIDIDRILVATFTEAAAAEMRERITGALMELSDSNPSDNLARQLTLIHNAQISTLHSFCLSVVRGNYASIDLDPAFRVADDAEIRLIREQVMEQVMEDAFEKQNAKFLDLVQFFAPTGKGDDLEEEIYRLCDAADSAPFPQQWLAGLGNGYAQGSADPALVYLEAHLRNAITSIVRLCGDLVTMAQSPMSPAAYAQTVLTDIANLNKLLSALSLADLMDGIKDFSWDRLKSVKTEKGSPEDLAKEAFKKERDRVKRVFDSTVRKYCADSLADALTAQASAGDLFGVLIELAVTYYKRLQEEKRKRGLIDFSDMEHLALRILVSTDENGNMTPTPVAQEYRDYFEEILVDEYQDTNNVQDTLIWAVSRGDNVFMVGDVKQSIYRFRNARPKLFMDKYEDYQLNPAHGEMIALRTNFRSRGTVIDSVNKVFEQIMNKSLGGIAYDVNARLYAGRDFGSTTAPQPELLLYTLPDEDSELNSHQMEALGIACKIKELVKAGARYGDIAVLLEAAKGWAQEFLDVFMSEGIPAYTETQTGYYESQEVSDVLALLRVIDNPLQDIPLLAVMKGIFGMFTDEELACITKEPTVSLYERVVSYDVPGALKDRCEEFVRRINEYRDLVTYLPISKLLARIFADYSYKPFVSALPGGNARLANVELLEAQAAGFEQTGLTGLFHFVHYVEEMRKAELDIGEAGTLGENDDVVRIMTIHKSKGLEFPIVFVAGLGKRFNLQETTGSMILDEDLGLAADMIKPYSKKKYRLLRSDTLRKSIVALKIKLDSLAEELRVLYVAMTRAEEQLYLTAVTKDAASIAQDPARLHTPTYLELITAKSMLDLLIPVFPNVIAVEPKTLVQTALQQTAVAVTGMQKIAQAHALADHATLQELERRFAFTYPRKDLAGLYHKTNVTELKRRAMEEEEREDGVEMYAAEPELTNSVSQLRSTPTVTLTDSVSQRIIASEIQLTNSVSQPHAKPVTGSALLHNPQSGTLYGTAMHRALELLDLDLDYPDEDSIASALDEWSEAGRMTSNERKLVNVSKILRFAHSPIACRMRSAAAAGDLYREQRFVYGIAANRLKPEFPETETVLIQGIIDAMFIEDSRIVIVDYKTDRIDTPRQLIDRYRVQLDYYGEAASSILDLPVAEKVIYSLCLGTEIEC